ncbi:50S ribosomal protein L13 [Thalassoroseus pseudoceratinae]|uniref:50S ribosomal protein L13 n=1 Tax=Thalassoroseus pseudoceratinae TaxID=2713176 RepID=UPI0014242848|nr:50S ribosomal protein L13 [Thalassoroseus pseudoceratinae]
MPSRPILPRTTVAKKETFQPEWYVVDGTDEIVGRFATRLATVLMGKHKPTYTPHVDTGDYVIVTNAHLVRFSGSSVSHDEHPNFTTKFLRKTYDHYTGYPGGRKVTTAAEVWKRHPERILEEAVRRMLPKNKLGRQMLKKLKLCCGPEHPHQSQQPVELPEHLR